jgi:hypothetical protein
MCPTTQASQNLRTFEHQGTGADNEDSTKRCVALDRVDGVARAAELLHTLAATFGREERSELIYDPALEGKWKHPDRDDYCLLIISGDAKKRESHY